LTRLEDLEAWARAEPPAARRRASGPRRRRILPVASGKGGVGKTTFALNFALELSRHGRTVLVDLDTGTSSLRACLDVPVARDLYHFFRKATPLGECVTRLPETLDPRGSYRGFGFVAAPRHFIEDLGHFDRARRAGLGAALEGLDADFVVLDLRAGLDDNVLAFLPFSNSGILIFTPHLPAASRAAADVVKALLFRKLRTLFGAGSPLYATAPGVSPEFVRERLARVEDAYDDERPANLDAFVEELRAALGEHPFVEVAAKAVDSFAVHYVLNLFDGVGESYERAVRPFIESLERNVSAHLPLLNLGWVVRHEVFDLAARQRLPALLCRDPRAEAAAPAARNAPARSEIDRLAAQYLGSRPPERRASRAAAAFAQALGVAEPPPVTRHLDAQLDLLVRMYEGMKGASWRDNFRYVAHRALHVMQSRGVAEFGDVRVHREADPLPAAL
jgi:MinD-like ATPase involved in chromosome partitioning or flagellar assembly